MNATRLKYRFRWTASAALVALSILFYSGNRAQCQTVPVKFSGAGATSFDGWVDMNSSTFSGFGGFPGGTAWPSAAASNAPGSGDSELVRMAGEARNTSPGGPFFSSESLYFGSFIQVTNASGGTVRVSDPTPVSGVKTIALQVEIGEVRGYGFVSPGGSPVLKVNGIATEHAPSYALVINRYQNGTFQSPQTGEEPIYVKTIGYQWDVAELGPVNSIEIDFSAVTHAQIYELRLDQTSSEQTKPVFVPEYFRLVQPGTPQFDGVRTTVTHSFHAPASRLLSIGYSENLNFASSPDSVPLETGDGILSATFTADGDKRTAWTRQMFFRAGYPTAL